MAKDVVKADEPEIDERVDKIIWRHLGLKSAKQIADEAGVTPEYVLRRKRELIEEIDILSIQEKRTRLLVELDGMARDARERAERMQDEFFAGALNSATAAIKTMLAELSRMEKQDQTKIDTLNNLRIRELISLMDEVVSEGVRETADRFQLDEDEVFDIFNHRLIEAAQRREAGS